MVFVFITFLLSLHREAMQGKYCFRRKINESWKN